MRKAGRLVRRWNARMYEQGYRLLLGQEAFLERLLEQKQGGKTHRQIAERINGKLRELVGEYDRQYALVRERYPILDDVKDGRISSIDPAQAPRIVAELAAASSALDRAYWILRHIGMTDRKAKQTLDDGLDYLRAQTPKAGDLSGRTRSGQRCFIGRRIRESVPRLVEM